MLILRLNPARFRTFSTTVAAAVLLTATTGCTHKSAPPSGVAQVDFNRDVQPILASNCFACHGPDPEARKAGLRLDLEETAFMKRPGKPDAIVPGHPELSALVKRIESKDPHQLMPQTAQGEAKPMKPHDIAILKEWIAEGAHYKPHWAFAPPVRAALPPVRDKHWVTNPIDDFILARLQKEGMSPSPEADKRTLIRRVTLDLTGLLPTPQETDAFVNDTSPNAYERVVDRLLASPRYGEQRARYWLDYARYGDTHGLHLDNYRSIWPYRDYLIKAFNANMPFDEFVKEQLAGDLLPAKNVDQIVATGYVRAGISTNEGGTILEENRFNVARERAQAYGATFMGLTVGCAVCHDHKYDPTTQKDFYQLSAFFNNVNEQPFNGDRADWEPTIQVPKPENLEAYNQELAKRAKLMEELDASRLQERKLIGQWLTSKKNPPQQVSSGKLQLRLRLDEGAGTVLKNSAPGANPKTFTTTQSPPQWGETTWIWPDFRMDTSTQVELGNNGDFDSNQPFSCGGWLLVRLAGNLDKKPKPKTKGLIVPKPEPPDKAAKAAQNDPHLDTGALIAKSDSKQGNRGWDLWYAKGTVSVDLIHEWPKKAIRISTVKPLMDKGSWYHVFFTYNGSGKASGIKLYLNGKPVATKVVTDDLDGTIRTATPLQLGRRYPDADPLRATRYQDLRLYGRTLTPEEANRLPYEDYVAEITSRPISQWTLDQWHAVSDFYFNNIDETAQAIHAQIREIDARLEKLGEGGPITLVAEEKPTLAYADILRRGIYSARLQRVLANTPHFLPPLPANAPRDRLTLAKWTMSPKNPLTARVTVNRMWNEVFGTGLVETTEDFGIMGQRPSHPELLDWLAVEFRESGWNVKHMYKLMVMSSAYRQSAHVTPDRLAKDPQNLLLARGPRFRMDAEMLRDIALQSSGLLVEKIGGPSVKPYQPSNVWESVGFTASDTTQYQQDHGDALYRRSLYTFWKRMAIEPDMDAFDAPPRDAVCTRRQRTDTPLQALVTLDDPQWVEASRALAERLILQSGPKPAEKIRYLSELLLSHDPPPRMEAVLEQSFDQMERHYDADPAAARELISVGEKKRDAAIPAPELAAWTIVASEALNLDETLNK